MQELELELILVRAETLVVKDDDCDELCAVECAEGPSAAIEAFEEDRGVLFRFAGRPSGDLDVMRPQQEPVVFEAIDVLDGLAAVDAPDARDFIAAQFAFGDHGDPVRMPHYKRLRTEAEFHSRAQRAE
jgi:hypothetical protein